MPRIQAYSTDEDKRLVRQYYQPNAESTSQNLDIISGPKPNPVLSTVDEAVNALEVLTLHEEQAHNGDPEFILRLDTAEDS
ncbi:hypothetical protein V8E54_015212 [Elaphomyces granulatus]